ncbi:MAG: HAD-IA family hydrolase [Shimia sp.]|uniref:HAD family hydrolase n=1 Tax=Shimia sp. TaxID=1954381 RepID=UPI001B13A910|nr:HAD-IA family hydrolase [Shimia sp.]
MTRLEADIDREVNSVSPQPAAIKIWRKLRGTGVKIALCSNSGFPYGPAALACLPDRPDPAVFSYKVGNLKPEQAIYAAVCERLNLPAERILFFGDTHSADVAGQQAYGFRSCYIEMLPEVVRDCFRLWDSKKRRLVDTCTTCVWRVLSRTSWHPCYSSRVR